MFGGHGFYSGGKFFAFVLDDVLYFKVDAQSRPLFERVRLPEEDYAPIGQLLPRARRGARVSGGGTALGARSLARRYRSKTFAAGPARS